VSPIAIGSLETKQPLVATAKHALFLKPHARHLMNYEEVRGSEHHYRNIHPYFHAKSAYRWVATNLDVLVFICYSRHTLHVQWLQ